MVKKARADIVAALKPFHKNGAVRLDAAAWIVTAKAWCRPRITIDLYFSLSPLGEWPVRGYQCC
ncbi:MAG: hypothetical protein R3C58_09385 [Parvularculaceae bacterium]